MTENLMTICLTEEKRRIGEGIDARVSI